MSVSYPISIPSTGTKRIRVRQQSVVAVATSPTTFERQTQARDGQRWMLEIEYPPMLRATKEDLVSPFVSLNGIEGTFLYGDSANKTPRGTATGTPLVNGGNQSGYDLVTDGWTHSITGILKKGDWIQLGTAGNSRLYKLMVDANSDGSGNATLTLWPRLSPLAVPADNSAIVTSFPKGVFALTTPGVDWEDDEAHVCAGFTITACSLP